MSTAFLTSSSWIQNWIKAIPYVDSISLTEWLFYYVSRMSEKIRFNLLPEDFHRKQDLWEWWLLLPDEQQAGMCRTLRCFIKTVKLNEAENSAVSFSDYQGAAREMIEYAYRYEAVPMYLFYADCGPESAGRFNNLLSREERINNGCFLENALTAREMILEKQHACSVQELLSAACKFSALSRITQMPAHEVLRLLEAAGIQEQLYRGKVPTYVQELIRSGNLEEAAKNPQEELAPYIRGVGVIDLR